MVQMTMQDILDMKVMPEDPKFLTALIRSMAKEIIVLRAALNKLEDDNEDTRG
jgi:hypothetical protein